MIAKIYKYSFLFLFFLSIGAFASKMSLEEEKVYVKLQSYIASNEYNVVKNLFKMYDLTNRPSYPTNIYLSNSLGNDENPVGNPNLPWKSLARLNTSVISSDKIYMRGGDVWEGTFVTKGITNLEINTYGRKDKPVLEGSIIIDKWYITNLFDGIYHLSNVYATVLDEKVRGRNVTQVLVDNKRAQRARWPNNDYMMIDSSEIIPIYYQSSTQYFLYYVTSSDITNSFINAPPNYWTGATLQLKHAPYRVYDYPIIYSNCVDNTMLSIHANMQFRNLTDNNYWIENHIHALDKHGEWYYDKQDNILYMCWTNDTIDAHCIKASIYPYGFCFLDASDIYLNGFTLSNFSMNAIHFEHSRGSQSVPVVITSNSIFYARENGIYISRGNRHIVKNCIINESGVNGISMKSVKNIIISNCFIKNTALAILPSRDTRAGITVSYWNRYLPSYNYISQNTVLNSGYCGISFSGNSTIASQNFVSNSCVLLYDGGGIYTGGYFCKYSKINNNIVLYPGDVGIYIDTDRGNAQDWAGVEVNSNTVIGIRIYFNHLLNGKIVNNTIYNSKFELWRAIYSNIFINNSVVSDGTHNYNVLLSTNSNKVLSDSNIYCNIYKDNALYCNGLTLTRWQTISGQDIHSLDAGAALRKLLGTNIYSIIIYNTTQTKQQFDPHNIVYCNIYGEIINGKIEINPYSSLVLFGNEYPYSPKIQNSHKVFGYLNRPFNYNLYAYNGMPPYMWKYVSGDFPNGINISDDGILSGIPVESGDFMSYIKVEDARGDYDEKQLTIIIYNQETAPKGGIIGFGTGGNGKIGK